jgi:hypothetical protein
MQLRELQVRCHEAFARDDVAALAPFVRGGRLSPSARVSIYRNNAREIFRKALAASYPTVAALVGHDCFRTLARDYVLSHESRSGNLIDFGEAFPELLTSLYGGGEFAYLPDVARLDWAMERAYHAADAAPTDLALLAAVPAERRDELRFVLHPALQLVASRYPIYSIWRMHQPSVESDVVRLDAGAEHVLVARYHDEVVLRLLNASDLEFITSLRNGNALAEAAASAAIDPTAALTLLAQLEQLVAFHLQSFTYGSVNTCSHR